MIWCSQCNQGICFVWNAPYTHDWKSRKLQWCIFLTGYHAGTEGHSWCFEFTSFKKHLPRLCAPSKCIRGEEVWRVQRSTWFFSVYQLGEFCVVVRCCTVTTFKWFCFMLTQRGGLQSEIIVDQTQPEGGGGTCGRQASIWRSNTHRGFMLQITESSCEL